MSTGKGTKRSNPSLRENTTLMAANLLRASSFVLTEMALGSPSGRSARSAPIGASSPVLSRDPTMMNVRQVETESRSKVYVMEPDDRESVDDKATQYIHKVRRQNLSNGGAMAGSSNSGIPPPPSKKWAGY